jgi:cysteine desulfurase
MIYLDYSANTPVSEDVLRCFCETEREFFGNPNSTHDAGKAAKERMDEITVSIAGLMGAAPEEIIYTSCASESNNTALKGIAALARSRGMHIISTALEHSSVGGCLTALQEQGFEVDLVDIDRNGKIDLEHLRELLRRDTILVSVCLVDSDSAGFGDCRDIKRLPGLPSACGCDAGDGKNSGLSGRDRYVEFYTA